MSKKPIEEHHSGRQLHDRATRGEKLSPEEQSRLDDWYTEQDRAEAKLLFSVTRYDLSQLEVQVDSTLKQIAEATQRIQALTSENETLRLELTELGTDLQQAR
jgi:chromosome segregation ATPase